MRTAITIGVIAAAAVFATGCVPPVTAPGYNIKEMHHETYGGQLDAWWFARHIRGAQGELLAIEILYCPIVNPPPMVCRTGIVWERGKSALLK